ncbi:macro domain-like protein [Pisolithus croceorrhizus]|nr:macro domain-like protein [Pisolithus croceorrhizus]
MSNVSFILIEPPPRGPSNDTQAPLITEWQLAFTQHLRPNDLERFSFLESRLDQLKEAQVTAFDCVVSPANSYGIMDGGFDFYLSIAFSPRKDVFALTRLVQAAIRDRYYGFAPPGSCILVPGLSPNDFSCKIIAVCPTMRYPEELKWHKDIVYITMWSLLVQLETWNENADNEEKKIKKVLMTGLGTGVGKISPAVCAKQMALAVKHFLHARSEEGQKSSAENDYLSWDRVLNLAKEV